MRKPAVLAAVAACVLLSLPTVFAAGPGPGGPLAGPPPAAPRAAVPQATAEEVVDLVFMREEEKLARDFYLRMAETYGKPPFARIALSEQSHMDHVLRLLVRYRIADPAAATVVGQFANPELQDMYDGLMLQGALGLVPALRAGAFVEEVDIEDLVAAMLRTAKTDIDQAYEVLTCGSRNHLRAFAGALVAQTGQPYDAQVLPQATVDAILAQPAEQCSRR